MTRWISWESVRRFFAAALFLVFIVATIAMSVYLRRCEIQYWTSTASPWSGRDARRIRWRARTPWYIGAPQRCSCIRARDTNRRSPWGLGDHSCSGLELGSACTQGPRIACTCIDARWGWLGDPTPCRHRARKYLGHSCGPLIVGGTASITQAQSPHTGRSTASPHRQHPRSTHQDPTWIKSRGAVVVAQKKQGSAVLAAGSKVTRKPDASIIRQSSFTGFVIAFAWPCACSELGALDGPGSPYCMRPPCPRTRHTWGPPRCIGAPPCPPRAGCTACTGPAMAAPRLGLEIRTASGGARGAPPRGSSH